MQDKALYQQAFEELNAGTIDPALWAMVWTKAGGDENKAKASYVEARVGDLILTLKREKKAARPPLSKRVPWRLVGLFIGTLIFAVVNDAVARSFQAATPRWDSWLVGLLGSTLGLFLFPALCVLVSRGKPWGYRLGFLILFVAGCVVGADHAPQADGYKTAAGCLVVGWLIYIAFVHDFRAPTIPE